MKCLVSVIIPTHKRPQLVLRAVQSALGQTLKEIEVIVVIDGSHQASRDALAEIDDARLRVLELPVNVGVSEARNRGVAVARAEWIAVLDHDDEWLPEKLAKQWHVAQRSSYQYPVVACLHIVRTPYRDYIWPKRLPNPSEHLSDYLMARHALFAGEGLIQSSMLLFNKYSLSKELFRKEASPHEDWDWLLRVTRLEGVHIEFIPDPLSIWVREQSESISFQDDWQFSLNWIENVRDAGLVTPRAYAAFVLLHVGAMTARQGNWQMFWPLLRKAIRYGKPKPIDFALYFGIWLVPYKLRQRLRAIFSRRRGG